MSLTEIWQELEDEPGTAGLARRRLHPDSSLDLFVAIDQHSRRRLLLFIRPWANTDRLPEFPATRGIQFRSHSGADGRQLHLTVELTDAELVDVFSPLVEDLAARMTESPNHDDAVAALAGGLAHWQDLFEQLKSTGMGTLVRRGLAGELMVLRDVMLSCLAPSAAVDAWTGPLKANQDFQLSKAALEVKVTTGKQPQVFRVANERELDDRSTGVLILTHLALDERHGGNGDTLNDLIDHVENAMDGHPMALTRFREKLARVGYLRRDAELYLEPRYAPRERRFFEVSEGFPRIMESDLGRGVGDVQYSVTLAACLPFEVDEDRARHLIDPGAK